MIWVLFFVNNSGTRLETGETLLSSRSSRHDTKNIETHSLREWPALSNRHSVTFVATEARRDVCSDVCVALLVTLIFLNVMKVISADDESAVHLCALDLTAENTTADRHITGEGALLVDVVALDRFLRGLETEANGLVPSVATLAYGIGALLLGKFLVAAGKGNNEKIG